MARNLSVSSSQHLPRGQSDSGASVPVPPSATTQLSLTQGVYARRSEFIRPRKVRLRVGTWNVAAFKGVEKDLGEWFVGGKGISEALSGLKVSSRTQANHGDAPESSEMDDREPVRDQEARWSRSGSEATAPHHDPGSIPSDDEVGIYVLGLQEIVDITSAAEALRPYTDPQAANKFKDALNRALPNGYQLVAERQLIGLLLLVYVSPTLAPSVANVSTTSVGTGLMGYMGNKGAVTTRIILGETTRLAFINCHMSAGAGKADTDRRNWDAAQISQRTSFDPITDDSGITRPAEKIGDEDFAFWFGDLNYRLTDIPPEDVRRLLMLHTRNEYDIGQASERKIEQEIQIATDSIRRRDRSATTSSGGSSSTKSNDDKDSDHQSSASSGITLPSLDQAINDSSNPTTLQATLNSLLIHDELHQQQKQGKMFHDGWREGPITFLPTYKYDRGTVGVFDSGEKKRGPSWCDRILYRTREDRSRQEEQVISENEARKRDNELRSKGIDKAAEDENTLFDYDPEVDGENPGEEVDRDSGVQSSITHVNTKEGYEDTIQLEQYTSHQRILSSDHKPLSADFMITYQAAIPELKADIQREVARELDRAENEGRPIITLVVDETSHRDNPESDGVDFGKLRFEEARSRTATIANTGRVPAQFGFSNRPNGMPHPSSTWVSVMVDRASDKTKASKEDAEWYSGVQKAFTINPGETVTVEITAQVSDKDLVKGIEDDELIEDILILRVKGGRDHFIPVRGAWHKSSASLLLGKLKKFPEGGLRKLQNQHPIGSWSRGHRSGSSSDDESVITTGSVPIEISRLTECIEALIERVLAEWIMLGSPRLETDQSWMSVAGWPFVEESWTMNSVARKTLVAKVNDGLDSGQSVNAALGMVPTPIERVEVAADCLLSLLRDLDDGVIADWQWAKIEQECFAEDNTFSDHDEHRVIILRILVCTLTPCAIFLHLVSFLQRIAREIAKTLEEGRGCVPLVKGLLQSPGIIMRQKELESNSFITNEMLINVHFANVFGNIVVNIPNSLPRKDSFVDGRGLLSLFLNEASMG